MAVGCMGDGGGCGKVGCMGVAPEASGRPPPLYWLPSPEQFCSPVPWRALTTSPPLQTVNFQQIIKGPGTTVISLSFHEPQPSSLQQNVGITAWGSRASPSVLSLSPEGDGCSFSPLFLRAFEFPFLLN